jgi:hypothetical protein
MADPAATPPKPAPGVVPPRRGPGHRGQDIRDTVAEMAAKAQEISMEAGSKMAAAMKDVVGAAAGISAFAIESARDLVQYMVRRGQMTQDEADKLIREVEEAQSKRKGRAAPATAARGTSGRATPAHKTPVRATSARAARPVAKSAKSRHPAAKKSAPRAAARKTAKPAAKRVKPAKSAKPARRR